ncbi:MAG: HlyC/CorC family transporter [Pedosphaera sp.]|nr:HlyC/CorC family transporter [Pedosphaera sp.]
MEHATLIELVLKLLLVGVIIGINVFFVVAEFALVKIRQTQLEERIKKGSRAAQQAKLALNDLDSTLSACQLGVTLASLALGWVGEPVVSVLLAPLLDLVHITSPDIRHTVSVVVGFTSLTFLHIVIGEQVPKRFAITNPLKASLLVARPLRWFQKATWPFVWVLDRASDWSMARVGLDSGSESESNHSHEELRLLLASSHTARTSTKLGREILLNALDLSHRRARDVMRPRQELTVLNTEASMVECLEIAERSRFSRFPLCIDNDLDHTIGVVHFKDLMGTRLVARRGNDLVPYARKLVFVPPTARLEHVLQLLLERRLHMAFVVDEYGSTLGMVTLENILEELVGQIQDEFDQEKPLIEILDADTWILDGALPLHDLANLVNEPFDEEDLITTSGWMTHRLEGFPKSGDTITVGDFELRVESLEGTTIERLRLTRRKVGPIVDSGSAGTPH